jgi:hypothetical protein
MDKTFKPGDKVTWNYAGNTVEGEVVKQVDQKYEVKSDKTGKTAVHRPEVLEHKK